MTFRIARTAPCLAGALLAAVSCVEALAQGDRYIPDPNSEDVVRHEGAALLFHKTNNSWSYVGILGAIDAIDEWNTPGLAMKNGVAMVIEKSARVFERAGSTWTHAPIDIPPGTTLITHYVDEDNFIYVTLRSSNRVSLRRLVHGAIETLGEQTLNVTPGNWYTLRMETVGNSLRMFVNGTLMATATDVGPPAGQIALATYKSSADFDDFLAYQP